MSNPANPAGPNLKSYILIRDSVPTGFAVLAAAHASLAMYLRFHDDDDMRQWLAGPITEAKPVPAATSGGSVMETLAAVRRAVVGYALQIVAIQDVDPSRIEAARKALAPIDALRERQANRTAGAGAEEASTSEAEVEVEDSVTPATPVPTIEDTE
ncbi:hypothetical protein [Paraliomyxa miuraensis]|uniref:hypothetical protein n=1 Tax=Paraliomyxa miuraensis TaxID=376150 RepID=UPI002251451F|nr:hypothetical protein [Paraliomyxa miuraensis]MCX4239711.1 hypothetical protein [Paraliomyxa miuraensis]